MRVQSKIVIILLAAVSISVTSCKSKFELLLASNDVPAKYAEAFRLYDAGKFNKSAQMFESLSMFTAGKPLDDTVRFYWAMSNYKNKDYLTAEANFNSYIERYPRSSFAPEARYLKLDCMYRSTYRYELDQNPTNLAIVAISEYMMDYPKSENIPMLKDVLKELNERLDRKGFEAAYLYYKMEDYIASKTAFRNLLKDDPDNIYREKIMYFLAKSYYNYAKLSVVAKQKERYMDFIDSYFNFVAELPESEYRAELDALYKRAQQAIDPSIKVTEKQLKKQRREEKKMDRKQEKAKK